MTAEEMKAKVISMEQDLKEIKDDLKAMPEQIASKINESVDLKIKLALAETEKKYQAKFISMLLAIIAEGIGLIFSFFMK
jgi:regulator of replication initiation timing